MKGFGHILQFTPSDFRDRSHCSDFSCGSWKDVSEHLVSDTVPVRTTSAHGASYVSPALYRDPLTQHGLSSLQTNVPDPKWLPIFHGSLMSHDFVELQRNACLNECTKQWLDMKVLSIDDCRRDCEDGAVRRHIVQARLATQDYPHMQGLYDDRVKIKTVTYNGTVDEPKWLYDPKPFAGDAFHMLTGRAVDPSVDPSLEHHGVDSSMDVVLSGYDSDGPIEPIVYAFKRPVNVISVRQPEARLS